MIVIYRKESDVTVWSEKLLSQQVFFPAISMARTRYLFDYISFYARPICLISLKCCPAETKVYRQTSRSTLTHCPESQPARFCYILKMLLGQLRSSKYQIYSLIWLDQGSKQRSISLCATMSAITPPRRFDLLGWFCKSFVLDLKTMNLLPNCTIVLLISMLYTFL